MKNGIGKINGKKQKITALAKMPWKKKDRKIRKYWFPKTVVEQQ